MRHLRLVLIPLLVSLLLAGGLSFQAQSRTYTSDQISQMVAPIALYPDALMSQVLMAATFPDQVTEADQWVQANPGLTGSALDDALATATWDPSVIALCKFPTVLDRMAQNIQWTTDLGNAFLSQKASVMDAVQTLRSAAYQSGHLRTTPQQRVVVEGPDIVIQPYTPDVIYVPTYEPAVVYGPLWSYPTYYYPSVWGPWPGYSFVNGFAWGLGFAVGNVLFGGCDWNNNSVYVNNTVIMNNVIYHNSPYYRGGYWRGGYDRQPWTHQRDNLNYARGGGAPYGGRSYGRVHGVPARLSGGGLERAATHGPGAYSGRSFDRTTAHGPGAYTGRGFDRTAVHGPAGYTGGGTSRPAVHGPTGYTGRGNNRAAVHGPTGYTGRNDSRPAVHGPTGRYAQRAYSRPAVHGPTGYTQRAYSRPAVHGPTGYAGRAYNRPAAIAPRGYSRPQYNRQAFRAPANYARPSYNRSYARPAQRAPAYAPRSYGGGGGHAPAAHYGGHGGHKRR